MTSKKSRPPLRGMFDGGSIQTLDQRKLRLRHSMLRDVQGIGLDLLPEYLKHAVVDEKYKNVEDMEVILTSESVIGHVKEQSGYLPSFVCQVVGLQPKGTKNKRLIVSPEKVLRDDDRSLTYPYDSTFRRAALTIELEPQFDVLDAPWIIDQCLRYRQMLEVNSIIEGKEYYSRNTGSSTVRKYPQITRGNRYDVLTRRMEYGRSEPYSTVHRYTRQRSPHDVGVFKDLLTGFYGTAYYGSGYTATYGGYPLYGYNYMCKPYSSIHGLYGDGGRSETELTTTVAETTMDLNRLKYVTPPPLPRVYPQRSSLQTVTEVTTTTTTTEEEDVAERKRMEEEKRRANERNSWTTVTTVETTEERDLTDTSPPQPPPRKHKSQFKSQQMVTICTYDSKQGVNSDPMFQASTARTIKVKDPELNHNYLSNSTSTPLNIEPVVAPPTPPSPPPPPRKVPEVRIIQETTNLSDSSDDVSFEDYIFQSGLQQKASSYPDLQQLPQSQPQERSISMRHLSPRDNRNLADQTEEMVGGAQSMDSFTYVFVGAEQNRARSLGSMTAPKRKDRRQNGGGLLRPVSEPDWEVINGREYRGNASKETLDSCIQTSGSLENVYWTDYPDEEVVIAAPRRPHAKTPPPASPPPERRPIRVEIRREEEPIRRAPEPKRNVVYKVVSVDNKKEEPEHVNIHTSHHHHHQPHHYREEYAQPDEDSIIAIVKAYLSNNMGAVAKHKQVVNGSDAIYYGDNHVIVVDQPAEGDVGSSRRSSKNSSHNELHVNLSSLHGAGKPTYVRERDRHISEIIENYLKSRQVENRHRGSGASSDIYEESPVFVIHDNGAPPQAHRHHHHRQSGQVFYAKDKDGVERCYEVGYAHDVVAGGTINIYIHEVGAPAPPPPPPSPPARRPPSQNRNHSVTIHVKHDHNEVRKPVYVAPKEPTHYSNNTLDLSFSSDEEPHSPPAAPPAAPIRDDELERLREERRKILGLLGKESKTSQQTIESAEAKLNFLHGQTASILQTVDFDNQLSPLPVLRQPRDQEPDEVELLLNVTKKNYHTHINQDVNGTDLQAQLREINNSNNRAIALQQQRLSRLSLNPPSTLIGGGSYLKTGSSFALDSVGGLTEPRSRSMSTLYLDRLPSSPVLPTTTVMMNSPMTSKKLSKIIRSSSREILPSKFVPSPVTGGLGAKKAWMNLNTGLFKSSTATLQDRLDPSLGQYLSSTALHQHHNVMRRTPSVKTGSTPYFSRTTTGTRQRYDIPPPPPLQDYSLESPISSASAAPFFRFDEYVPSNHTHNHTLSLAERRHVPFTLHTSGAAPTARLFSQERLYQGGVGGGIGSPRRLVAEMTGYGEHSHGMSSRYPITTASYGLSVPDRSTTAADCPVCRSNTDISNLIKTDSQAGPNMADSIDSKEFTSSLDKYSTSNSTRYPTMFDPPRYDQLSHASSSRDSAFFSDLQFSGSGGSQHFFKNPMGGLSSRGPPGVTHHHHTTYTSH